MTKYFVFTGNVSNLAYAPDAPDVKILNKSGSITEISSVSDMFDHQIPFRKDYKIFSLLPERMQITKYYHNGIYCRNNRRVFKR